MPDPRTILLVGGTGRTGRRVLEQLLSRGLHVRAIVRSAARLPPVLVGSPGLTVVEASLLSLPDAEFERHVGGCDAVISCLGHVLSLKGVLGPPRDLVTRATIRLCRAIEAVRPATPIKFILMTSVSVNHPGGAGTRRGAFDKALLWLLRGVLPPARDNQRAADFLHSHIGPSHAFVQWVTVRPDTLLEGDVTEYRLHEDLVSGLFAPSETNMANIAHFMTELVTDAGAWEAWKGKLPVIVNAVVAKG